MLHMKYHEGFQNHELPILRCHVLEGTVIDDNTKIMNGTTQKFNHRDDNYYS